MIRYTNEFLTDGDITIERVANRLKLISEGIKNSNKLNLCDINVICEEIFGKILNTLYGYELVTIVCKGSHIMLPLIWWTRKIKLLIKLHQQYVEVKLKVPQRNL